MQAKDLVKNYLQLISMTRERIAMEMGYGGEFAFVPEEMQKQTTPVYTKKETISQADSSPLNNQRTLQTLAQQANNCTKCRLSQTRSKVVFGTGASDAALVIVGEAPGFHEDQQGIAFVGKAGQLLNRMLAAIQLKREDIYICNVIKCRPPENRDPAPEELIACRPWLAEQLKLISPKLICGMGKFASAYLSKVDQYMWQYRGNIYEYEGIPVICTYHPAYLLRNPDDKRKSWEDLKRIRQFLDTQG